MANLYFNNLRVEYHMMHKLLNDGWEYESESQDEMTARYTGFGCKLFNAISIELPTHYQHLTLYKSKYDQTGDVFAISEGLGHDFGIQLDPDCEVICLWDAKIHVEIGYWSNDEYKEAIEFIKSNFC
jgi:hypothetical protein